MTTPGWCIRKILTHEKQETATAFWGRANANYQSLGITAKRVLSDKRGSRP